jgi:hypothetical protein
LQKLYRVASLHLPRPGEKAWTEARPHRRTSRYSVYNAQFAFGAGDQMPRLRADRRWGTLHMRASEDFLRALDEWREKQPDQPSGANAVRRLVEKGMGRKLK